jgi:hypothetical protein
MRYISEVISLLHLGMVDNLYKKKTFDPIKTSFPHFTAEFSDIIIPHIL